MEKYQNQYRIPTARAAFWNYGWNAAYFVTICTQHRICWFGEVIDGKMVLSEIGEMVQTEWLKTFEIRPDMNLFMGEYVIMPNHFHAIIGIGENQYNTERIGQSGHSGHSVPSVPSGPCRDAMHCVSTAPTAPPAPTAPTAPPMHNEPQNKFGPQSKNLASIVRGFKIGVTKNARILQPDFAWQPRYHDHIIRNESSYQTISQYIIHNPEKWPEDKLYPQ